MRVISHAMVLILKSAPEDVQKSLIPGEALDADQRSFRRPRSNMLLRQVHAGHTDDRLPRGFLAGAIVEVWLALRFNWACELPLSRGEKLP